MSRSREAELHYPLGDTVPAAGATIEVAPGVRWLRMPLPFVLDHINLWLLRDVQDGDGGAGGWTLVDCGVATDATRAAWEQLFERELGGLPLLRVICTHMHPDHLGLADWLTQRFGCRLWISATDWVSARLATQSTVGVGGDAAADFFASHGLRDPESLQKVRQRSNHFASLVPAVPGAYRRLQDGQTVRIHGLPWRCIAGYGHAPEHIALYRDGADDAPGVLISGDMVLPRITTNVSVVDLEPEADSLTLYLASLERYRDLPGDTLVLPSHGRPFSGLHQRLDQLREHHDERLAEVMSACAGTPCTAAELLPVLFRRPLDLHQTTFAMGEAVAHLHALWHRGRLRRERGADGVYRFAAV